MKVDIKKVAEKAGVSIATVSRVFSNSDLVRQPTKDKVLKISKELNYIPNPIARSLSRQLTDTIGVVLPDLVGEFFMDIIHGIDEEAYKQNWFVLVSSSHSKRNILETLIEFMGSGRVDGVILMAPQIDERINEIIRKSKRPIVLINAGGDTNNNANFKVDNFQGAYTIVEHLIQNHSYKIIGMVEGPKDNYDAIDRSNGYYKALQKYGLNKNGSMVVPGDFSVEGGYHGFKKLISNKVKPDAIFMANDMMAVGAYQAAKELKIRIPEDIALVGFDDIYLSQFLHPRLTTVHVPIAELGSKAVIHLLGMIKDKKLKKKSFVEILSTCLVIGGSCGCA
ncbi:MAG: LacI family transcriptional regulator [Bacteroidetes bacterium]|nr:LacI family transcriptional regulator [Bacteroidota bacterium]